MPLPNITSPLYRALFAMTRETATRADIPITSFPVGAAVLTFDGRSYRGCNVEDHSLTLTVHAEQAAIVNAVGDGVLERAAASGVDRLHAIEAVAVYVQDPDNRWPCGLCRQFLIKYGLDMTIISIVDDDDAHNQAMTLRELMPFPFQDAGVLAAMEKQRTKGTVN